MGLELDSLFGAVTNLQTAYGEEKPVNKFLKRFNEFGIQVKNDFEVNFSGLEDITFFVQSISLPGMHQNFTQVYFNGRVVDVPINHEFDHSFSMTILNDAQGYIYSAITNFILSESTNVMMNNGYTMTLKALTGDMKHYAGSVITLNGCRLESIAGVDFGQADNAIQTFTVTGKLIDFTYSPGKLTKASGIVGAVSQLIG